MEENLYEFAFNDFIYPDFFQSIFIYLLLEKRISACFFPFLSFKLLYYNIYNRIELLKKKKTALTNPSSDAVFPKLFAPISPPLQYVKGST